MKAIVNKLLACGLLFAACILPIACSDWNAPESVDLGLNNAKDQNPELWAQYMQVLSTYKQSKHYVTYARFDNSPEKPVNEGSYLRSLPDSVDIVTLCNPENITDFNREDIPLLREKSTRILYLVDYAAQASTLSDATTLEAWLDKAINAATELNLDGFAFTGIPIYSGTSSELTARKEAAQIIVSKLSVAASSGKLLVLEGSPDFVASADLRKLNYIALNTADLTNITELKLTIAGLPDNNILPREKLLLSARIGDQILNEKNEKINAVYLMTDRVPAMGPLGGIAIYSIGNDYYNPKMNYENTRTVIQQMNPSK